MKIQNTDKKHIHPNRTISSKQTADQQNKNRQIEGK